MPARVTLTVLLTNDVWGVDDCIADGGGEKGIKELVLEDITAFVEEANWKIEIVE